MVLRLFCVRYKSKRFCSFLDTFIVTLVVPSHPLLLSYKITSAKGIGKVEIDIPKAEHSIKWSKLGTFLSDHDILQEPSTDTLYLDGTISEVTQLTHDTRLYTIALPEGYHMPVPTGHHVRLKSEILGKVLGKCLLLLFCNFGSLPSEPVLVLLD